LRALFVYLSFASLFVYCCLPAVDAKCRKKNQTEKSGYKNAIKIVSCDNSVTIYAPWTPTSCLLVCLWIWIWPGLLTVGWLSLFPVALAGEPNGNSPSLCQTQ